jgi:DCN1-like protein 1/2
VLALLLGLSGTSLSGMNRLVESVPESPCCCCCFFPLLRLGIDSIDKLKSKLGDMRGELQDTHRFQEVYNYSFQWACEVSVPLRLEKQQQQQAGRGQHGGL